MYIKEAFYELAKKIGGTNREGSFKRKEGWRESPCPISAALTGKTVSTRQRAPVSTAV
jgi:hypothetical protein